MKNLLATLMILGGVLGINPRVAYSQSTLAVAGWPFPYDLKGQTPPLPLGNDPIIGRLACPPILRLDIRNKVFDPVLITSIKEGPSPKNPKQWLWVIDAEKNLVWWSGEKISTKDYADFISEQLNNIVNEKSAGLWEVPQFKIDHRENKVFILWATQPKFGPNILAGVPLWRPLARDSSQGDSVKYECAGLYKIASDSKQAILLQPNTAYSLAKFPITFYRDRTQVPEEAKGNLIEFKVAKDYGGNPAVRLSDDEVTCETEIDLPVASTVIWNVERNVIKDAHFRALLTNLIPRGALLRSGAAGLGTLLSAPIPRNHPGYDAKIIVKPYGGEDIGKKMDAMGYKTEKVHKHRLDLAQNPIVLHLAATEQSKGLVEKVIADGFASVGIDVTFSKANGGELKDKDGLVTGLMIPWPELNYLGFLHSKSKSEEVSPYLLKEPVFDELLERYALSLTMEKPDFSLLYKIHDKLFELEPMTVLLQHKACLESPPMYKAKVKTVDVRNPDWFRSLIGL